MKKILILIIVFILILYIFFLYVKSNEIKVENIATFNNKTFTDMEKRGFLPKCFPKNIKNIIMVWDIDTNDIYMKFDILDNRFYNFYQCRSIEKEEIKLAHRKMWFHRIIYPNFVIEMPENIDDKNIVIYLTHIKNKIVNNRPFYILINLKKKKGYAFSG